MRSSGWWCDGVSQILSPSGTVELIIDSVGLAIGGQHEDVDTLHRLRTGVQDESPSPCDDVAGMPDIQGGDLVDTTGGTGGVEGLKARVAVEGDTAERVAAEEVGGVGDFLDGRVGDGGEVGSEGGGFVTAELEGFDEVVDVGCCAGVGEAVAGTLASWASWTSWTSWTLAWLTWLVLTWLAWPVGPALAWRVWRAGEGGNDTGSREGSEEGGEEHVCLEFWKVCR